MVRIRLRRTGAKKQPSYRVVVADQRSPRDGRFIEIIGHYNPRTEPATVKIQEDRALHWLSVGAQMTDTVERLFKNLGTLERFARYKEGADLEALLSEAEATARAATSAEKNVEVAKAQAEAAAKEKVTQKKASAEASTEVEASTSVEAASEEDVVEETEEVSSEEA